MRPRKFSGITVIFSVKIAIFGRLEVGWSVEIPALSFGSICLMSKSSCSLDTAVAIGRLSFIDLAPDYMGIIRPYTYNIVWETVQKDFLTIEYEGVIITSIGVLRRELARELLPITFQS